MDLDETQAYQEHMRTDSANTDVKSDSRGVRADHNTADGKAFQINGHLQSAGNIVFNTSYYGGR